MRHARRYMMIAVVARRRVWAAVTKSAPVAMVLIGLLASTATADELLVARYTCERDNFNDTSWKPLGNYGQKANGRMGKNRQETTWYADWSEDGLADISAQTQLPPPAPYTGWEVRLGLTGVTWEGLNPSAIFYFGAFFSKTDWNANEGCDNADPAEHVGACHLYADDAGGAGIPWTHPDGTPVEDFWDLPELTNSVPLVGYVLSQGPHDLDTMQLVLDASLLDALVNDPTCRGLRCWAEQWTSHQVYARGQWGCPAAAGSLLVYAVPEPATLIFLGEAIPVLLKRQRKSRSR